MYHQLCGNHQNDKDGNVEETERRKLDTCDVSVQHIGPVCVSCGVIEEYYNDFIVPSS